jgi:urease alpha subunit
MTLFKGHAGTRFVTADVVRDRVMTFHCLAADVIDAVALAESRLRRSSEWRNDERQRNK